MSKYVLEEFSRLISSRLVSFLLPFYLCCGIYSDTGRAGPALHCIICLVGVCCEVWCHANRQLAHPEDAVYLPRIMSNPDDGGDENSDKICHG